MTKVIEEAYNIYIYKIICDGHGDMSLRQDITRTHNVCTQNVSQMPIRIHVHCTCRTSSYNVRVHCTGVRHTVRSPRPLRSITKALAWYNVTRAQCGRRVRVVCACVRCM